MIKKLVDSRAIRIRALLWIALCIGLLVVAGGAHAAKRITSASLNGVSSVTVAPGASISATVNVQIYSVFLTSNRWRCTSWRIGSGAYTTVDTKNVNGAGTYSETFGITAPSTPGTYDVTFIVYSDESCTWEGTSFRLDDAVTVVPPAPNVLSINRASANPAGAGANVSWTVTFDKAVTGVDAADFVLAPTGSLAGTSITQVSPASGSSSTWTVSAYTGTGSGTLGLNLVDNDSIRSGTVPLGGVGTINGNFSGEIYSVNQSFCDMEPANTPPELQGKLTCRCDTFERVSLDSPSPIFNGKWIVSTSDSTGKVPEIIRSGSGPGFLRLTDNTKNNAKAATVPGIFPARGNYISVEFKHYAYGGCYNKTSCRGADGIAVTLSDYAVTPRPGAFGGSLGYAQKTGIPGFAGGWIGVALDEYGNYQNPSEGRIGGTGEIRQSVGVRGSGSEGDGYRWLAGTAELAVGARIDNSGSNTRSPGYSYQVIVDARNYPVTTMVAVNRDVGSGGYQSLINAFDVYARAKVLGFTQAVVPDNWQISFTGSTGDSINYHEIGSVRICAQTFLPSEGATAGGFNAIDEAYGDAGSAAGVPVQDYLAGHIYTKLVGKPFKLNVAALANSQIQTSYAGSGKDVTVKLVDNSDGTCILDSGNPNYCNATCKAKSAVENGNQTLNFTSLNKGQKRSADFIINTAYRNLVAIIDDKTTSACATDAFSVRPLSIESVTSADATNTGVAGEPAFKAGSGKFSLKAQTTGIAGKPSGYNGVLKIDNSGVQAMTGVAGSVADIKFPAAVRGTPSSTASDNNFTYSEVGAFRFLGYDPATNGTSIRGVYDGVHSATECKGMTAAGCDALRTSSWTGVDSVSTRADCIVDSYSNVAVGGKYGCNFGLRSSTDYFGRFKPDHFLVSEGAGEEAEIVNRNKAECDPEAGFTYMGEPFRVSFTLKAMNAAGGVTRNYAGSYAKLVPGSSEDLAAWMKSSVRVWLMDEPEDNPGSKTCDAFFSDAMPSTTTFKCSDGSTPAPITRTAGPRVTVVPGTVIAPNWVDGRSSFAADLVLERADKPDGPYQALKIGIAPKDTDDVQMGTFDMDADNSGGAERKSIGATELRHGRLLIPSLYGSDQLGMSVKLQAQYWEKGAYRLSADDSCSPLVSDSFSVTAGVGGSISTSVMGGGVAKEGISLIRLSKPKDVLTKKGSVILKTSTDKPAAWPLNRYLPGTGTQTFGVYRRDSVIYLRELY